VLGVSVSEPGLLAAWGLLAKGTLGVLASLTLAATTEPVAVLAGLRRLRMPDLIVQIMGFMIRYLDVVTERGFRLPPRYLDLMPAFADVARALAVRPLPTVPCHNDLLAENLVDDGERLWLVDYEYAGNNEACFELGNVWSESTLPVDALAPLVEAYFGTASPALVARARLFGLASKYGWTLWASIQDGASSVDFDFWTWGMEKYERAVEEFDGPDFARLLEEAAAPD